ncbi:MAG: hypothetical protein EZS28_006252 [Streblomastix strix]|uniref:Uncharacterized protein n=1 Tax=Streblomastix strix TaxID=222440 RepID=A0A5J4WTC5_9EUKA|nr:MAG: hypothetical protein EZS28_006252 [Streblomastix strix]
MDCDPISTTGVIANYWSLFRRTDGALVITLTANKNNWSKGLLISADGNILTFNRSVIAGIGTNNGATNGTINYSAGNPILQGVNRVGTEGGFYSNGANAFWSPCITI